MSDWKRKTQEVSFENLMPEMVTAIKKHIEQYNLGPILSDAMMCIQTDSKNQRKVFSVANRLCIQAQW